MNEFSSFKEHPEHTPPLRLVRSVNKTVPHGFEPRNNGYFRGLVAGVRGNAANGELMGVTVSDEKGKLQREVEVHLEVVEAAAFHEDIIAATGAGPFQFSCEGLDMTVLVRYMCLPDVSSKMALSFFVAYDGDYRGDSRFEMAHNVVLATLLKDIKPEDPVPYSTGIYVSYGRGIGKWQPNDEVLELLKELE